MAGVNKVPTLEEVARLAGVSRATASRVVNDSPKVTPEVAKRVRAAIVELNYVPNRAARSLVSRKAEVLALIVPESVAKVFGDPFFATVVQGIALALADTQYTLNLVIESDRDPAKIRRFLRGGNVDGAMVVSHHLEDATYTDLASELPLVFGGRPLGDSLGEAYVVDVDNIAAARMATEHLLHQGARRVGTIAGPQDMPPGVDRLVGFTAALDDAGLPADLVAVGDFTQASGQAAMEQLLAQDRSLDAVFAANDQMAYGAYAALERAGLVVGQDVAVLGFDDDHKAATATPPLSTVRQPREQLGATMARILLQVLAGEPADPMTILPTDLVLRASA